MLTAGNGNSDGGKSRVLTRQDVGIVNAGEADCRALATCHAAAFPGEFLTLLGPRCLEAFYRFFAGHPEGICLAACGGSGARMVGLVAGGCPYLRAAFIRHHVVHLVGAALVGAWVHPRVRARVREHAAAAFARMSWAPADHRKGRSAPVPPGRWSNLLSIGVHPEARRLGLGQLLMEAFRMESARRGYRWMRLSVHNDNSPAIELYRACGWESRLVTPRGTYFVRSVD